MNVNPLIMSALSSLNLPVVPNVYLGDAQEYITFDYLDERPGVYADGEDILDETTVRVNCFTKGNPQTRKKEIRRLLRAGGFSIISTSEFYESDTTYNHVVVEASIDGIIND